MYIIPLVVALGWRTVRVNPDRMDYEIGVE